MRRIIVFSGTYDGRMLIERLINEGFNVTVCVATALGAEYLKYNENIDVISERLDLNKIKNLFLDKKPDFIIDATHPYATEISINLMSVCSELNILYARFERKRLEINKRFDIVNNYDEAIDILNMSYGNILVTTGINNAEVFKKVLNWNKRIYIRILNTENSLKKCIDLGFEKDNIILSNGILSVKENIEQIEKFDIKIMVSKESGEAGGFIQKSEAVLLKGLKFIVISRPQILYDNKFEIYDEILEFIKRR